MYPPPPPAPPKPSHQQQFYLVRTFFGLLTPIPAKQFEANPDFYLGATTPDDATKGGR